jgi:spermidine synthase
MSTTPINISEENGIRYLHFGSVWVQGAMRIRRPIDLELEYTREMMFGLLLRDGYGASTSWPRRVLIIGLGAGSLAKFCYWKLPQTHITAVEIDTGVWSVARQLFKLPEEDKRLEIVIEDGVDFIARPGPGYDYIFVDGYDENAKVGLLESLPFYQACRARLNDKGIVSVNLFGRSRKYAPALSRLSEVFGQHVCALPQCASGNVIALATLGAAIEISLSELHSCATQLKTTTGLDLSSTIDRLAQTMAPEQILQIG